MAFQPSALDHEARPSGSLITRIDGEATQNVDVLLFLGRMATLRGQVVSGMGNFAVWIERLADHYTRKTGLRLYPGTLNLALPSAYSLPRDVIRLEASEYGGRVSVNLVPCRVFDRAAFLLRTDQNEQGIGHHPRNVIEIATDVRLRNAYT